MNIRLSVGERIFKVINYIILFTVMVIALYPCWFVLVASLSNPDQIYNSNGILLWPKDFGLYSYSSVLEYEFLWIGYRNTIFYTIFGTALSVVLTILGAFGLSRKGLPGKNIILGFIMVTMYFSGGMIPTYMVVRELGLLNSPLAMILPSAMSTFNLIITLTYFRSMPYELEEAAKIDGASDYLVLLKIMMPLATPIIAVITLYYGVAMWNNYFSALLYIQDRSLQPLQLVIREILIQNSQNEVSQAEAGQAYAENVKYTVIVVSTIPIMCVYPFLQKYFVKGIMIGAIKG